MKSIFIASYDMEIGGVERSLVSMLNNFDFKNNNVDLFLHSQTGELMTLLSNDINLIPEIGEYKTFRCGIKNVFKNRYFKIGIARLLGKLESKLFCFKNSKVENLSEYQYIWKRAIKNLPQLEKEYDVAISYLWPHNFIAEKVKARKKIAWIHTDYSTIRVDRVEDLKIWSKYDTIIAISSEALNTFLKMYPTLKDRCIVVQNITSPKFVKNLSKEKTAEVFSKDCFNIVSVARFSYAKGIDNAISALQILKSKGYKNIKWYVVGYGGDEKMLKELCKKYSLENEFIFLGKKTNPYPYIAQCDLYVQPSRYEGKAVTVLEAQILNKPVLITNYPTAASQIIHGVDGEIVELSINGIASGIERFYKNKELLEKYKINCSEKNFENKEELEKLYERF
ncbi:MAG: glycosyltransferase [Fusobacteriaceae bacterium]